jgi:hypothetical protein
MKKYTIKEILKTWKESYNENMLKEYSGFFKLLKKIKK